MAEFVDITSLSDASDSMNNFEALWVQVSATQRIDLFKLANSTNFINAVKSKLGTTDVLGTVLQGFVAGSSYAAIGASDTILSAFNKVQGSLAALQTAQNNMAWKEETGSGNTTLDPNQVKSVTTSAGSLSITLNNFDTAGATAMLIVPASSANAQITFAGGSNTINYEENTVELLKSGDSMIRVFVIQKGHGSNLYINGATYTPNS